MAETLSESDSFDATIQMPTAGEEIGAADLRDKAIQRLANRTTYLKSEVEDNDADISSHEDYCYASITGSSVSSGSEFTLAIVDESGGFTVSGNNIVIAETGVYTVSALAWLTSSDGNDPLITGLNINIAGSQTGIADGIRWSSSTSRSFPVSAPLRKFDATASDELSVTSNSATASTSNVVSPQELYNYLLIRRIS